MKNIIVLMLLSMLLLGSVSALMPRTTAVAIMHQYSEICPAVYEDTLLSRYLPFLFKKKVSFACEFRDVVSNGEGYNHSSDLIRSCYRACWNNGLEFKEYQVSFFSFSRCICENDNLLQKEVAFAFN